MVHQRLPHPIGAGCDHQHRFAAGAPEQDRLGNLGELAADGVGCLLCGVRARVELDNGARIAVAVRIDRTVRRATIDFTGTSAQLADNFNAPTAIVRVVRRKRTRVP